MSTRKTTKTITLPDGDVLTIRQLSGKHLRQCAEAQMFEQLELMERMAGMQARVKAAMGTPETPEPVTPEPVTSAPAPEPDPMTGFSARALLLKGMLSVEGEALEDEAAREAFVDDLSQADTDVGAREILRLASPKLFLAKAEREAARKND